MFSPNIFATPGFMKTVLARAGWTDLAVICDYLININFFTNAVSTTFKCPMCELYLPTKLDLYRHLYRNHNPFPAYVMNRMKAAGTRAGLLRCAMPSCVWEGDTYEKLIQHVCEEHRWELLQATDADLAVFLQDQGELACWVHQELENFRSSYAASAPGRVPPQQYSTAAPPPYRQDSAYVAQPPRVMEPPRREVPAFGMYVPNPDVSTTPPSSDHGWGGEFRGNSLTGLYDTTA
jgi:hypothetical protein